MYADLENKLLYKLINILLWENENIGTGHDIGAKGVRYHYTIHFDKEYIEFIVESSWAYGGYDTEYHLIPYEKVLSDDWKDKALLSYQKRLEGIELMKKEEERTEPEIDALKEEYSKWFVDTSDIDDLINLGDYISAYYTELKAGRNDNVKACSEMIGKMLNADSTLYDRYIKWQEVDEYIKEFRSEINE